MGTGCERFSRHIGYADSFKFAGPYFDKTPCDPKGRKKNQWVAIDAFKFSADRLNEQFQSCSIFRELNKVRKIIFTWHTI